MSAKFDPNIELPSNPILIMAVVLVLAAFGVVAMIIVAGDAQSDTAAAGGQ